MRRRVLTLLAVLAAVAGVMLTTPQTAYALGDLCRDVPEPAAPRIGMSGLFTLKPAELPPPGADPITNPTLAISDVYGTSYRWGLYDLGCTPNALTDPGAVINTTNANLLIDGSASAVAVLDLLERAATESGMGWLTEWVENVVTALRPLILGGFTLSGWSGGLLPLAVTIAAVWALWQVMRKMHLADGMRILVTALVCMILSAVVFLVPAQISRGLDAAAVTAAQVGGHAFSASLADGVNRHGVYRAWLAGNFGDADSPTARRHGAGLLRATHYTWREWDEVQASSEAKARIDADKEREYRAIADDLRENDPAAYTYLQGRQERTGPALFSLIAVACMGLFAFVAGLIVLAGRFVLQGTLILAPFAAVAALLPKGGHHLRNLAGMFVAALFAIFKFTLAAGILTVALGLLSSLDPLWALLCMGVLTAIGLYILRPFRTFKTMLPGVNEDRSYLREIGGMLKKAVGGAVSAGAVGAVAGAVGGTVGARTAGREWVGDLTASRGAAGPQWADLSVPPRRALNWSQRPAIQPTHFRPPLPPAPAPVQVPPGGPDGPLTIRSEIVEPIYQRDKPRHPSPAKPLPESVEVKELVLYRR